MKIFWYMIQPLLCLIGFHDWSRGKTGYDRYCEYCKLEQKFSHMEHGVAIWRSKDE